MTIAGNMKLKTVVGIGAIAVFLAGSLSTAAVVMLWPEASDPAAVSAVSTPAPAPAADPDPVAAPGHPAPAPVGNLNAAQTAAMGYVDKDLGSSKLKDVSKGKPYKINVYQDEGKTSANRLKIDLNRNEKWDEKWTFDGDSIQRQVAPADDENYSEVYLWNGSDWEPE